MPSADDNDDDAALHAAAPVAARSERREHIDGQKLWQLERGAGFTRWERGDEQRDFGGARCRYLSVASDSAVDNTIRVGFNDSRFFFFG